MKSVLSRSIPDHVVREENKAKEEAEEKGAIQVRGPTGGDSVAVVVTGTSSSTENEAKQVQGETSGNSTAVADDAITDAGPSGTSRSTPHASRPRGYSRGKEPSMQVPSGPPPALESVT